MSNVLKHIGDAGLVPVVVVDSAEDAVKTARALLDGGLDVMEITLRTEAGIEAIRKVKKEVPEMLVGAGTVLTVEKAREAKEAGAAFIVSPGLNEKLVQWCLDNKIDVMPGCVTPTEITRALDYGLNILKFFPADLYGGEKGAKALHGPFRMVKFVPTGGVNNANLPDFAGKPYIHAVGGSWLCPESDIRSGNFQKITDTVREAVKIVESKRQK